MAAPLIKGQDRHLIPGPAGCGLRRHMTFLTRQMGRYAARRGGFLEIGATRHVPWIAMAILTLTNQRMVIIMVHGQIRGVTGRTSASLHHRDPTDTGRGCQHTGKGGGIEGVTGAA